jgi:hypothetical protein
LSLPVPILLPELVASTSPTSSMASEEKVPYFLGLAFGCSCVYSQCTWGCFTLFYKTLLTYIYIYIYIKERIILIQLCYFMCHGFGAP